MHNPSDASDSVGSVSTDDVEVRLRIRQVFDEAIAHEPDADRIANLELCREFFLNEAFRKELLDVVARINGL